MDVAENEINSRFSKERIMKNTLVLCVRMLFTLWLNLYATRLVLRNLGLDEMGVYSVVGSIVGFFTILSNGVTNAVQRFITYETGRKGGNPNKVFCSSINVILIISVIMILLMETCGLWFLNNKANIPDTNRDAAFWVFQLSVLVCIVNTVSIPYNALIIAHEKISVYAMISILQVILNFLAALMTGYASGSRLLIYAMLIALASIIVRISYQLYCHKNFPESHYRPRIDKDTITQILKFTGVTTTSGILQIASSQGIVMVINILFGVALNAVYTIALQLKNSVQSFSFNILKAISPQITKTYANGEHDKYEKLTYSGSKFEVFLIYFIMIPFLFRAEYILKLWLGNVPEYAVVFSQSVIFLSLTYAAFEPIRTAVLATGRIKRFMIIPDAFYLLSVPVSYMISKATGSPSLMIISVVAMDIISCLIRIHYALEATSLKAADMIRKILIPCVITGIADAIVCLLLSKMTGESIIGLLLLLLINSIALAAIIYSCGLSKNERLQCRRIIKSVIRV